MELPYKTIDEIIFFAKQLADQYPSICKYQSIGNSKTGREIPMVVIGWGSKNVLMEFGIHGDEKVANEMGMRWAEYLIDNQDNYLVEYILSNSKQYLVLAANPDGYAVSTRKNSLIDGVDLNRNFGYHWSGCDDTCFNCLVSDEPISFVYRGPSPFSESETQALRDLVSSISFSRAIVNHSGTEALCYPWAYTKNPSADYSYYQQVCDMVNDEIVARGYAPFSSGQVSLVGGDRLIFPDVRSFMKELSYMKIDISKDINLDVNELVLYCHSGTSKDYYYSQGIPTWLVEHTYDHIPPYEAVPDAFQRQLPIQIVVSLEAIGEAPPSPPVCKEYMSQNSCEDVGCYWWSDGICRNYPEDQVPPPSPSCNEGNIKYEWFNKYRCVNGEWVLVDSAWPMMIGMLTIGCLGYLKFR